MAKVERSPGPGHDGYNGSGDHGLVPPLWALNHLLSPDTQGAEGTDPGGYQAEKHAGSCGMCNRIGRASCYMSRRG